MIRVSSIVLGLLHLRVARIVASCLFLSSLWPLTSNADGAGQGSRFTAWSTVGGGTDNARYSPLSEVNTSNVDKLGGVWLRELKTWTRSPPVVANGVLYINDSETVYALNPRDGATLWEYTPGRVAPARGGLAVGEGRVFCALADTRVVALDANSGRLVWTGYVGNAPPAAAGRGAQVNWGESYPTFDAGTGFVNSAPTYINGIVTVGLSGGDGGTRGKISGLDAKTGKTLWNFYVIPASGDPGSETWPDGGEALARGGGAVWTQGAADARLGLVYYGTGNAVPVNAGESRPGNNLFTSAVVALDVQTGKLRWHYQLTHHDLWEMDVGTPIVLYTARVSGRERPALAAMRTDGYLFLLDRATGSPLFKVDELPVKQDTRQRTSPTQPFPAGADRFGPSCVDPDTAPPGFRPGCYFDPLYHDTPDLLSPFMTERQAPMSFDLMTQMFYVMGTVSPSWQRRVENPFVIIVTNPPGATEYGIYGAIDSRTNKIVWQNRSPWGLNGGSGALTTAGGLLFHMEGDGTVEASDAKTGKLLWQFQTGYLGMSGGASIAGGVPLATFRVDGEQYVVAPMGKGLWAFKLHGPLKPKRALRPPSNSYGFTGVVQNISDEGEQEIAIGSINGFGDSEHFFDEYAFVPKRAQVKAGHPFKWTNYGVKSHTIVVTDGSWTTGEILPGQSVSIAISQPGTYVYYAREYPWARGQLVVR